jgi:hypothetical protein
MPAKWGVVLLGIGLLSACASVPTGPSVLALPAVGKPMDIFQAEEDGCRAYAQHQTAAVATPGDVLYLALEDGERRAKQRLTDQMQAMGMTTPPSRLSLVLWEAPRLGEGLEEALIDWLDTHSEAKLIVINILEKVQPRRSRNGSVYQDDYLALAPLQRLAQERGIAIVIVHHANKGKAEDFRDGISGAMSLAGAADTLWILQRLAGEADAALRITGRDVETLDLALQFRDGFWTALGDAEAYRLTKESKAVVEALQSVGKPMTPKQLAQFLGIAEATIRQRLVRMAERGEVLNLGMDDTSPVSRQHQPTMPVSPLSLMSLLSLPSRRSLRVCLRLAPMAK